MSSVIVAVLVKPEEFTCTFSDRILGVSKSKIATIFLRNLFMSYLYPLCSSICQNHLCISQYFTPFDLSDLSVYCYKSQYLPATTWQYTYILEYLYCDFPMPYSTVSSEEWISSEIPGVMQGSQWNCVTRKLMEITSAEFFSPFSFTWLGVLQWCFAGLC